MTIPSIAAAVVIGMAAGAAGLLVLRSARRVPAWVLMAIGVAAALGGAMAARLLGVDTSRLGYVEIGVQVVAATVAVIGADRAAGESQRRLPRPRLLSPQWHRADKNSADGA